MTLGDLFPSLLGVLSLGSDLGEYSLGWENFCVSVKEPMENSERTPQKVLIILWSTPPLPPHDGALWAEWRTLGKYLEHSGLAFGSLRRAFEAHSAEFLE